VAKEEAQARGRGGGGRDGGGDAAPHLIPQPPQRLPQPQDAAHQHQGFGVSTRSHIKCGSANEISAAKKDCVNEERQGVWGHSRRNTIC